MKNLNIKIAAVILVLFVCAFTVQAQEANKKVFTLEPNKPIEQEITGIQIHTYEIKAEAGQFMHIILDQKSIDIFAVLYVPNGRAVLEVNDSTINRGPEQIFFITTTTGLYRIEIGTRQEDSGRYEIMLETLRAATTAQDKSRVDSARAFKEGEQLSAASNFDQAVVKYQEALTLRNGLGDRYDEAVILYSLGKTYNRLGDKEKALDSFRKSLTLFQTAGSWDDIFKDLRGLYLIMGGKQKTFDYLANALPLVRALKNQRLEAILLTGIAKVCEDMNEKDKMLDYYNQALALFRITGKRGAEVFSLTEIQDADLSLEDKKKAIDYLNQAILLSRGASDKALEVTLLMGIAYIYNSIDDHQNALNYFRQTLPLWRELKDKNGEAYTLSFIGGIFYALGDSLLAQFHFEQALTLFQEAKDLRAEARTLSYLANLAGRSGDTQKALESYQKSLKVFRDTGDKNGVASVLSFIGETYWTIGNKQKALDHYQQSLLVWRSIGFREGEAINLLNIGYVYDWLGDVEKASNNYNQALPIFRLLGNQSGEATSLYGIARVNALRGNVNEALTTIETAINIIESLRAKIANAELRASYLASYQHFYRFYTDLLMQLHQSQPEKGFDVLAFQANERARARSLLDILNEARADIRQGINPSLLERERALQNQLEKKEQEKTKTLNKERAAKLESEIQTLTKQYQELQSEIKIKSPKYAALTQPQPVSLKDVQQMLDADTILLEYSLSYDRSYLWVVSQNSIKTFRLPKQEDIETAARRFYETVKDESSQDKADTAAKNLSRLIIEPIANELGNKRLLIVADGALQYIPFAALSVAKTNSTDNGQPLIINHEIVYLPSASVLSLLRNETNRKPASKVLAVLADPVFNLDDPRVKKEGASQSSSQSNGTVRSLSLKPNGVLTRLPGTRREANGVSVLIPESERMQALDFKASRVTAMSEEISQYRILHFATHGILNSQHPELSAIVLSLVDEKGNPQDGFLRLHEIYNLKLSADLIVLSACQTALGKDIKGEGLLGLTRGFMYAGAPRVAASLWEVDDKATSELMKLFYQRMLGEKKLPASAALREAQIEMWKTKRFNAPYYWSAFTIQGEWR